MMMTSFFSDDVASEARARNPATRQEESVGLESSVNVVGSDEVNVKPRLRLGLAPDLAEALTSDARSSDTPTVESKNARRFVSHLWSVQLSEGLPWKPCAKFSFRHSSHINLLEAQVRKVLAKRVAAGCRYIVLQDSKVCLGAFNKGRSGSERLNRILGIEAAYQLAKDVIAAAMGDCTSSTRAYARVRSSTLEYARVRTSTHEYARVRSSTLEYARVGSSTHEYARVRSSTLEYARVRTSTRVRSSTLEYARVRSSTHEYARVRSSTLEYARVRTSTLEYARVRSSTLEYARVRTSTHEYARVRSSTLEYARARSSTRIGRRRRIAKTQWIGEDELRRHIG